MDDLPMKAPFVHEVVLEVPFHDVDSMGVVWHGHYVKYLEIARTALTRLLGSDVQQMNESGLIWPVVQCQMKYIRPLRYGQNVRVRAELLEYQNRIKVGYVLRDGESGEVVHKATTIQLPICANTGELLLEVPPDVFPAMEA
jgi:acyl-CoA thioester hydrolase